MTDKEIIARLRAKIEVYRLERDALLRVIRELWDCICRHESVDKIE